MIRTLTSIAYGLCTIYSYSVYLCLTHPIDPIQSSKVIATLCARLRHASPRPWTNNILFVQCASTQLRQKCTHSERKKNSSSLSVYTTKHIFKWIVLKQQEKFIWFRFVVDVCDTRIFVRLYNSIVFLWTQWLFFGAGDNANWSEWLDLSKKKAHRKIKSQESADEWTPQMDFLWIIQHCKTINIVA